MRRSILFIYLFVILFSKFFFILLDYDTDDEAKGLLDDSEENGKNNWTTTTITLRGAHPVSKHELVCSFQ